jgi:hypothetical protein
MVISERRAAVKLVGSGEWPMPAHITVESGITAGSMHVIEKPVVRIGSGSRADIRIPAQGFADHALTLEFRSGAYHVHNRDSRAVAVGRAELRGGESVNWLTGQPLRTPDGMCLVLHIGDDAVPRRVSDRQQPLEEAEAVDDVSADLPDPDGAERTGKPLRMKETCIIVGCALAGLLMLVGGPASAPQEETPTLAVVLRNWQGEREVVYQLQHAHNKIDAGAETVAKREFLEIRNQLLARTGGLAGERSDEERQLLEHVNRQLMVLQAVRHDED